MRVIGIDPGYGIIGWSIVEKGPALINYGTLTTPPKTSIAERLLAIHTGITSLLSNYSPDCAAIERLFFNRNSTTALDVSKALGVLYLAFAQSELPITEYTPTQIKKGLTGYGNADKTQIQEMVKRLYRLETPPQPDDAADAVAIATVHALTL